jgi:hypothetical protein
MSTGPATEPGAPARALLARHRALATAARAVLDHLDGTTLRIAAVVEEDRQARVRAELGIVEVEQLGALTDRNLRLRALVDAGYRTAADLLGVPAAVLDEVPGVGMQTARTVVPRSSSSPTRSAAGSPSGWRSTGPAAPTRSRPWSCCGCSTACCACARWSSRTAPRSRST